eukprot:4318728-Pyramimonas_sp.AAC.1
MGGSARSTPTRLLRRVAGAVHTHSSSARANLMRHQGHGGHVAGTARQRPLRPHALALGGADCHGQACHYAQ